jgi:hypothetical protein
MSFQSETELKTIEFPDALEFTVYRESSFAEGFVAPVATLILLFWVWYIGSLWLCIVILVIAAGTVAASIADRINGNETTLRVTVEGVIARGNLGHLFSTHEQVGICDLASIRYHPGDGEGEAPGLYAHLDWGARMLLPHISGDQANLIIERIRKKFPGVAVESYSPFSPSDLLIFDHGEQVITLGLSKADNDQQGLGRISPEANNRIKS